ncbi:methyltransferase [Streptomyces sp. NRRL WC-3742]|uniref:methyltransferase n=1 Tax=Streptomyces sp. NRRL WC-3742 TaxID=1463934 RepID=UPI0004C6CB70|nr:methyltransferase [Streptomyces sp. NRRL WC-3742]
MTDDLATHQFAEAVSGLAPAALRAAATRRLADHIDAGHDRLPALAERTGTDPDLLECLLRFLVCREVFAEPHPGEYGLTGLSAALLDALMRARPHLRTTLVDLPDAAHAANDRLTAAGHGDRFTTVAGSFFDPLPPGADVHTLVNVLHNWNDADILRILRRCAQAAGPHSTIPAYRSLATTATLTHTATTPLPSGLRVLTLTPARSVSRAE